MSNQELNDLWSHVRAIEARQRAQGVHDPDCARVAALRAQHQPDSRPPSVDGELSFSYLSNPSPPCDCWLSREAK